MIVVSGVCRKIGPWFIPVSVVVDLIADMVFLYERSELVQREELFVLEVGPHSRLDQELGGPWIEIDYGHRVIFSAMAGSQGGLKYIANRGGSSEPPFVYK